MANTTVTGGTAEKETRNPIGPAFQNAQNTVSTILSDLCRAQSYHEVCESLPVVERKGQSLRRVQGILGELKGTVKELLKHCIVSESVAQEQLALARTSKQSPCPAKRVVGAEGGVPLSSVSSSLPGSSHLTFSHSQVGTPSPKRPCTRPPHLHPSPSTMKSPAVPKPVEDIGNYSGSLARVAMEGSFLENHAGDTSSEDEGEVAEPPIVKTVPHDPNSAVDFQCPVCGKEYASNHALQRHQQTHDPNRKVFTCWYCFKDLTKYDSYLSHHKRRHPEAVGLKCLVSACKRVFYSTLELTRHIEEHSYCRSCNELYATRAVSSGHICSGQLKHWTCAEVGCQQKFPTWQAVLGHNISTHQHTCRDCGVGFLDKLHYDTHIDALHTHQGPDRFFCRFCQTAVNSAEEFRQHFFEKRQRCPIYHCKSCGSVYEVMHKYLAHRENVHAIHPMLTLPLETIKTEEIIL